jgi:hypothetical protein
MGTGRGRMDSRRLLKARCLLRTSDRCDAEAGTSRRGHFIGERVLEQPEARVRSGSLMYTKTATCFTAALITYRRCFTTGVPNSLADTDAETLASNSNGAHARIRRHANKLAAHSVNPFDLSKVGIMVRHGKDVVGLGSLSALTQFKRC